jgi:hypothetical protein
MLIVPIVIGTSIWVYFDAKEIGAKRVGGKSFVNMGPVAWMVCCLLLWIVVFPIYLAKRAGFKERFRKAGQSAQPPSVKHDEVHQP